MDERYDIIRDSYNTNEYNEVYRRNRILTELENKLLNIFQGMLPTASKRVLDICCGSGVPYSDFLASNCSITGIDISSKQIERAVENIPTGKFVCDNFVYRDITDWIRKFDGVICMYGIFHFMENDLPEALKKINRCLKDNGVFFMNMRTETMINSRYYLSWCGQPMYWWLPGVTKILCLCTEAGFSYQILPNPDNPEYVYAILKKEINI